MRAPAQLPPGGRTKRDDWATPGPLFRQLSAEFGPFTLDAAASPHNAKVEVFFTEEDDGLSHPWVGRVWVNPPYRSLPAWVAKGRAEVASGRAAIVVMLLPARTGTRWFHESVLGHAEIRWLRGRLRFDGAPANAPFDSFVAIWRGAIIVSEGGERRGGAR